MNAISDIMFWISTGLLVPVIVLLILLFFRSRFKMYDAVNSGRVF